ncbi:ABC-2 transporter permease [Emergencia sp.]|uniref:ABC-2 transporter permease n=1 Tax=Emergencia sp. TaxID=1926557 RepID=UPI003AF0D96A
MRGLVLKDSYVLLKQMKLFGVLMLIMAVIPNTFTRGFAIMYASMLPITAISFDEQAKWDYYANMMPYKKRDMALSKYIIGIIFTLVVCVVEVLAIIVTAAVKNQSSAIMQENLMIVPLVAAAAMILMSINLPLIMKMGAERGRMVYILLTVFVAVAVVGSVEVDSPLWQLDENLIMIGLVVIAIAALLISMAISVKVYNGKRS